MPIATNLWLDKDVHNVLKDCKFITVPSEPYLKFIHPKDVVEFLVNHALNEGIIVNSNKESEQ